ncbi:unnamed protein product [Nezara viridula]|uniref:Uncharacterized protein n=1 Tax=Nezara viridula TaxID=85310 RepID=A0A9P0MTH7_NEZVI|nr:unnamed protein product [Nezara viridula]
MSTPRPSMKLLVESGIVPRAPNQRPLTLLEVADKQSLGEGAHLFICGRGKIRPTLKRKIVIRFRNGREGNQVMELGASAIVGDGNLSVSLSAV